MQGDLEGLEIPHRQGIHEEFMEVWVRELLSLNVFDTLPDYEAIMGIIYSVKPTILRRSIIHYQ